jgi:hypothetical protein
LKAIRSEVNRGVLAFGLSVFSSNSNTFVLSVTEVAIEKCMIEFKNFIVQDFLKPNDISAFIPKEILYSFASVRPTVLAVIRIVVSDIE